MANLISTSISGTLSVSGNGSFFAGETSQLSIENQSTFTRFAFNKLTFYDWNNGYDVLIIDGGYVESSTSFRAPIFYDSQNTGYYLDPNSTSNLNTAYAAAFYGSDVYTTGGWFRNHTNNNGIYWQGTGWHLMPENSADFRIHSGNNSESALRMETNGTTRGYVYVNSSNEIGFLNQGRSWRLRVYSGGAVESYGDFRAPIFYDSQDTNYYLDPNSTTALRTVGSWRSDSAAWDGEFAGKIQYHSNNWYFQASSYWYFRNSGGSNVVRFDSGGNVFADGFIGSNSSQTRDKLRVWDSGAYTIGMKSGYDYGHLGNDEYAMSFQMNDNSGRGFWWGDEAHNDNQGAASLTTDGRMTIARSLSVGEGEAVVSPSSTPLFVKGSTSGADVVGVDGINGRLFTVTDDLSNSLFSVNTIAGLPVIEAFADNTVNIGKYGSATTWSTTGFVTMPNSANIYRDLFINGGRGGNFGNRLIIGTDAATYTMQDGNQRPTAYLHGAYPVLTLNHTVSNGSHGPTIQFAHNTENKQWVIGSNGTGTRLDIGYSTNTDRNPHNGIDDYNGSTFLRVDNGGNIQLGRGNGRSTWVNDTLYVGASDSGDAHMYFGEDSSGWYGLHWYWDSAYTVYLYGRNAGTDTEIMRYTTNSNAYVEWRRHFHMNNYEINYLSQVHFNAGTRFVGNSTNYLNFQTDSTSYGGIQVRDGNSTVRGYSGYYDSSGFGLLNSSGNWGIRLNPGNVETLLYYAGAWRVQTLSGGVQINGNLYIDTDYGHGIVGVYDSYRYQGVWAMGDAYKLLANGTGTGNLYGLAWTHTNVGGQSKAGLEHQLLIMNYGTTLTALGNGIWTSGLITTTSYGTSANWNTAYGWGNHAGLYQPLENQRLSTGNNVTFNQVYTNNWFRNNASNTGLYNEATTMHLSSQSNGYWDVSSTNSESAFRFYTGGHVSAVRGYVYANSSNQVGFLNNSGSWSLRTDASRNTVLFGQLTVGQDVGYSSIYMYDSDEGTREIHCNSNRIGFLTQGGSWGAYLDDSTNWYAVGSMQAPIFYDSADTSYYVDPNSYSRLWRTSTHWGPSPGVGSSNWVTDFNNTPVSSMSFGGDLSAGGPQGTWWFQQNMRHGNSSNYWGTQIAWGWEDNANELWQRNVTGGNWSGWVRYINTNNYAGILDARYYTETEVNNLLSSYATTSSLSGYVATTYNTSLNSDSRNTRGVTRLYRRDDNSDFSVQTHWTGTYWRLEGYYGDTYHAGVSVAHAGLADLASNANYATSAGSASSATSASYASGLSRYGIIYGNDWNSYNVNGQFIVMSAHGHSGSNRPSGAYTYGSGMSYYNSGSDHYQFYFPENSGSQNGNSFKIWYRSGWNNSWGGWRSIVDVYNSACAIDGTVTATGDVIAYSDARVKENVHTIENALDKTLKLRGVTYNRTDVEDKSTKIGVIAQEIMEVLPEVVSEDETGMYGVSYGNLTAVLIEAIKEQQKQIEELRNELNKLKG